MVKHKKYPQQIKKKRKTRSSVHFLPLLLDIAFQPPATANNKLCILKKKKKFHRKNNIDDTGAIQMFSHLEKLRQLTDLTLNF